MSFVFHILRVINAVKGGKRPRFFLGKSCLLNPFHSENSTTVEFCPTISSQKKIHTYLSGSNLKEFCMTITNKSVGIIFFSCQTAEAAQICNFSSIICTCFCSRIYSLTNKNFSFNNINLMFLHRAT